MKIRDAKLEDLPTIVAIYNSTIPSRKVTADTMPVTVESRLLWFKSHKPGFRPIWVVEMDGKVVGWVSFEPFKTRPAYDLTAELSIYIDAGFRGKGLGTILMEEVIKHCPSFKIRNLVGYIFGHNNGSIALFKSFGFDQWALYPGVAELDGIERDLVVLGKRIEW